MTGRRTSGTSESSASGVRLGHVNLEVTELARAQRFYDTILPVLGFRKLLDTGSHWVGYRKAQLTLWLTVSRPRQTSRRRPRVPTTGATDPISDHLGFVVSSSAEMARIERRLLRLGLKPLYRVDRVATAENTWYVSDAWCDFDNNVLELYTVESR